MDRREFTATGLSTLLTYTCGRTRPVMAAEPDIQGCRMASAGDASFLSRVLSLPPRGAPYTMFPWLRTDPKSAIDFYKVKDFLNEKFGVRPALRPYDDRPSPNAIAIPEARFPNEGPDGTVLLGIGLVDEEMRHGRGWSLKMGAPEPGEESLVVILAHEWGHILQFKAGMTPAGPWEMEPHADFLAGWFFGHHFGWTAALPDIETAAKTMFEKGDTDFNNPAHHGQPQLRAVMVRAGYEAAQQGLDVKAAFEKGRTWAGLQVKKKPQ
jgi:hypothetical protein